MNKMQRKKTRVILVYSNLGIGGIAKTLVTLLNILDYSKFDVTLYIRRDDVVDLINQIPPVVDIILITNEVKNIVFDNNLMGRIVKRLYMYLNRKHKHLAKRLFLSYKNPIQRQKEQKELEKNKVAWDVAISYSTDNDDPIFVSRCINAKKKYVFVHQSTFIAKKNVKEMSRFNSVISVNPNLEPWIRMITKSNVSVYSIENYVDYQSVISLANMKSPKTFDCFTIATCGRLCTTKGYDYVIQTAILLKDSSIPFVWCWIGDGPAHGDMERMINENELNEQVHIIGSQPNPYPYIRDCNLYVQPSRAESFGLTIVEAMVLNKPVIMTQTKGSSWIHQKYKCGILVDNSAQDIANCIIDLYNNHSRINDEIEKTQRINWLNERERYIKQWNHLLNDELYSLRSSGNDSV